MECWEVLERLREEIPRAGLQLNEGYTYVEVVLTGYSLTFECTHSGVFMIRVYRPSSLGGGYVVETRDFQDPGKGLEEALRALRFASAVERIKRRAAAYSR